MLFRRVESCPTYKEIYHRGHGEHRDGEQRSRVKYYFRFIAFDSRIQYGGCEEAMKMDPTKTQLLAKRFVFWLATFVLLNWIVRDTVIAFVISFTIGVITYRGSKESKLN